VSQLMQPLSELKKTNRPKALEVSWLVLFIIAFCLSLTGLFLGNLSILGTGFVTGFVITVLSLLLLIKSVKKSDIIFYTYFMIFSLIIGILGLLCFIPLENPYKISYPGSTTPVDDNYLEMPMKVNEHFNIVYVRERYTDNKFIALMNLLNESGIHHKEFISKQDADFDDKLGDLTTTESNIKPLIAVYKALGKGINFKEELIVYAKKDVEGFLYNGDKILKVNDRPVAYLNGYLLRKIAPHDDDILTFEVERANKTLTLSMTRKEFYSKLDHTGGIDVRSTINTFDDLPIKIKSKANEGGDSSGLSKALEVYQQITGINLIRGRKIVATGGIQTDKKVTSIGGLPYKYWTVVNEGYQIFLVPLENKDEMEELRNSKQYPKNDVKIIYVDTLDDAIEFLQK
jgi:PDZ domain-containing secreted protein